MPLGGPTREFGMQVQVIIALCTRAYHLSNRMPQSILEDPFGLSIALVLLCKNLWRRGLRRSERRIPRDGPARPAAWPELQDVLGACPVGGRRPAGGQALARHRPGRLTARPHQYGDPMAEVVPGPSAQRRPAVLTHLPWDAEALKRQRGEKRSAAAPLGEGVLGLEGRQRRKPSGCGRPRAPVAPWPSPTAADPAGEPS
jgi:hypothetical protein